MREPTLRLALVADVHGNLAALEAVVADLERRGIEQIYNLGDHVSGPLLPRETADYLMARSWPTLAGNHERQLLTLAVEAMGPSDAFARGRLAETHLDWLGALPATLRLDHGVFLCHGTPASDLEYFLETVDGGRVRPATPDEVEARLGDERAAGSDDTGPAVVACAHTHVARAVRTASGQLIVNPGSVGLPAYDDDQPEPHVMESGSPEASYAILERSAGAWTATLVDVPYDFQPMADLARRNGRPDWQHALRTGRMP